MAKKKCDAVKVRAILALTKAGLPITEARAVINKGGCTLSRAVDNDAKSHKYGIEGQRRSRHMKPKKAF